MILDRLGIVSADDAAYASAVARVGPPETEARDFAKVDKEIRAGLKNEKERIAAAYEARQWYEGNIEAYLHAMAAEMDLRKETVRSLNIFKRIVKLATKYLYTPGPERNVENDPKTTEYLRMVYDKAGTDRLMLLANRYAMVSGVCAIQVELNEPQDEYEDEATLALTRPAVRHRLWPADQFVVWTKPDAPEIPWCVGVIDHYDETRRLRVWTESLFATYTTEKFDRSKPWEGTEYRMVGPVEQNPLGFVPFAFVSWEDQVGQFWVAGPGDELQRANESVNYRLWKMNDDIHYQRSLLIGKNVRKDFRLPDRYRAGEVVKVEPAMIDALGNAKEVDLSYLAPELSHLTEDREDLDWYMGLVAENQSIPEAAYRLQSNGATSGVEVIAEQLPLIEAAETRHTELEKAEKDLFVVTLLAAGTYLNMVDGKAGQPLINAAGTLELSIQWGNPVKSRPGQAFDQHLQFKELNGFSSEINAIAEILNISRKQAAKEYERLIKERALAKKLREKHGVAEPSPGDGTQGFTEPGSENTDETAEPVEDETDTESESGDDTDASS